MTEGYIQLAKRLAYRTEHPFDLEKALADANSQYRETLDPSSEAYNLLCVVRFRVAFTTAFSIYHKDTPSERVLIDIDPEWET